MDASPHAPPTAQGIWVRTPNLRIMSNSSFEKSEVPAPLPPPPEVPVEELAAACASSLEAASAPSGVSMMLGGRSYRKKKQRRATQSTMKNYLIPRSYKGFDVQIDSNTRKRILTPDNFSPEG